MYRRLTSSTIWQRVYVWPISPIIDWKAASADVSSRLERKCGMANQHAESHIGGECPIGQSRKLYSVHSVRIISSVLHDIISSPLFEGSG